jgi:PAS domain S-box-containing protein
MQALALTSGSSERATELLDDSLNVVHRRADRLFAWLMIGQWLAGIGAALLISPRTWIGAASQTHWHVWAAIFLGGALTSLPVYFAFAMPGRALTRHTIAVAQMLFSALLIHLTGGRIETHFHVFGSLAFLAFYRDWRVLVTATVIVAVDHATRGMFFPQSVFGILVASPWRWIEHAGWVLFEDFFLFISIYQSTRDMSAVATHRADLEVSGEQRLAQAQRMAHVGSWEWNVITDEIIWSDEEYRLFGFVPRAFAPNYDQCLTFVHPDDRSRSIAWLNGIRASKESAELDKRIVRPNGEVRTLHSQATVILDESGDVLRLIGTSQDITERMQSEEKVKQSEERYRSLFEANPLPMWIYDLETLSFLEVNQAAISHYGHRREEFLAMTVADIRPIADRPAFLAAVARSVAGKIDDAWVGRHQKKDGSIIDVEITSHILDYNGRRGELVSAFDITERKRAELEREVISEIVQGVITTSNIGELLELARHSIGKVLYAENCFVALHDPRTDLLDFKLWVDKVDPLPLPMPVGDGLSGSSYVLRTGQPLLLTNDLKTQLEDQREVELIGTDSLSWLGVPLRTRTRTIGVLTVQHYEMKGAYSQRDVEFLCSVGDQIALAIERKQADEKLKQSEERLATAQKMAHVGSWEWDVITNKVVWSDEEYRLFGLEPGAGDATYKFYLTLVHPAARRDAMRWFNAVRAMKKSSRMDILIVRPDGQERILNSWADVVLDDDGNVLRVVGTSQDVTEREKAERALGQSEERFQLVSRATDDAIWDWDVAANRISFSESFGKQFGYRADEFEPSMAFWTQGIHPDDYDALMAGVSAFFASREEAWSSEYRFRCADGSYAFVFDRGYVVRDEEGKPLRMVGSMMNISERKRAEAERQIISEIAQGVITTSNLDGLLELAHRSIGKLLYAENCFVGLHDPKADLMTFELWVDKCDPVPPPQSNSKGFTRSAYVLRTGQPLLLTKELEAQLFEKGDLAQSGSVSASWLGVPLRTPTRTIGVLVVQHYEKQDAYSQRDLEFLSAVGDQIALAIERKAVEVELRLAKEAAEAASRAKSEFLANMSHEIRTPMNGIIGMTELALETELNRDQREYLGMVKSSAHSLLGLINDILDFSKIEAGKLDLESIDFSLRECIGGMLKPLGLRADEKGLELMADVPSDVPDHLIGDPMRLRQILINLTANAIKFTDRGEVVVKVINQPAPEGESHLQFSVIDTGIGIAPEKQAAIFEAFAQADGSTTRTYGGTGLGLSIASQLIQKMQGRIWVESKVGEGTTFHFTARLGRCATPLPAKPVNPRDLQGARALVVDDNAVNRRILREMLLHWRMKPTAVDSGAAALEEMTRAAAANAGYEIVLLDALMPEMDGFALAEKIHEQPALANATVMMLSSAMPSGTAERCSALGITGWLTKPVTQSELLDAILIAVSRDAEDGMKPGADIEAVESDGAGSGLRVLVAEDNLINRAVATGILEKAGHRLMHVGTGREAVEAFSDGAFDLIFMDVQMPEMDGFEATRRIRELEETTGGHIKIVAMTAHAMAGDRERCLAAGMDDYVSKPLRKEDLLRTLNGAALRGPEDKSEKIFLHSRAELLAQCEGDEELMSELVSIFKENTPQIVQSIGDAIEKRDAPALAVSAHKLLSSLGAFGARQAGSLALRLERNGQENDFRGTKERFTELERETDRIYAALA